MILEVAGPEVEEVRAILKVVGAKVGSNNRSTSSSPTINMMGPHSGLVTLIDINSAVNRENTRSRLPGKTCKDSKGPIRISIHRWTKVNSTIPVLRN